MQRVMSHAEHGFGTARIRQKTAPIFFNSTIAGSNGTVVGCTGTVVDSNGTVVGGTGDK